MNIYEKLQIMRCELQNRNIKKSGENTFSKYSYFELSDFLPTINEIMLENKVTSFISFDKEIATLTLVNAENSEEQIVFTSPMSEANLKGCHEVQNLGAVQTYERRYLYMNAFEIVESDILDKTHNKNEDAPAQQNKQKGLMTDAQVNRLYAIAKKAGISQTQVCKVIFTDYKKTDPRELNKSEYDTVCERIEKKVGAPNGNQ